VYAASASSEGEVDEVGPVGAVIFCDERSTKRFAPLVVAASVALKRQPKALKALLPTLLSKNHSPIRSILLDRDDQRIASSVVITIRVMLQLKMTSHGV
jgi:hypothetical protein